MKVPRCGAKSSVKGHDGSPTPGGLFFINNSVLSGSADNGVNEGMTLALPGNSNGAKVVAKTNFQKIREMSSLEGRSYDDDASQKLMKAFYKEERRLNNHVVKMEQACCGTGVRWIVAKPKSHGGPFEWGCSVCFALVTSKQWAESKHKREYSFSRKMTLAMLTSQAIPTLHNINQHMQSGLHEVALKFFFSAETANLCKIVPSISRTNRYAGHGLPSCQEIVDVWFAIRHGHSNRATAAKKDLE